MHDMFHVDIQPRGKSRVFPTVQIPRSRNPEKTVTELSVVGDIAKCLAEGQHLVHPDNLSLLPSKLEPVYHWLEGHLREDNSGTPFQDACDLLDFLEKPENRNNNPSDENDDPFEKLFGNFCLGSPGIEPDIQDESLEQTIDPVLLKEMVEFEVFFGAGQDEAQRKMVQALNAYARGQQAKAVLKKH